MHPLFVAQGPAFKKGYVSEHTVQIVDIYQLMCYVLDLQPGPNNGSVANVADLLKR